ncbi:MAG: hypothetical protein EHM84_06330 [Lysobacterales bacterium]|nr:MAG: hypothetical protein EHM84_06330 [Xanthomonadales bacterium]
MHSSHAGSLLIALMSGAASEGAISQLEFLVGRWPVTMMIYGSTDTGPAGGMTGVVDCRWGAERRWLVCDLAVAGAGGASYAVHVTAFPRPGGRFGAFVVNPFGGQSYSGEQRAGRLVFDADRATDSRERQRVTYRREGVDRIVCEIMQSHDGGESYTPHSLTIWQGPPSIEAK